MAHKIDFSQLIRQISGEPLMNEEEALTLKSVCIRGLVTQGADKEVSAENKVKYSKLANQIYDAEEPIELESESISELKAIIGAQYTALVVGQATEMLEGRETAEQARHRRSHPELYAEQQATEEGAGTRARRTRGTRD